MSKTATKTNVVFAEDTKQPQQETVKQKSKEKQQLILKLENRQKPRVSWTEDTIDNQHMNKLKSNLCCIYHKPGESSSDTCTSDDDANALERDRHTKHLHKKKCSKLNKKEQKAHKHHPNEPCSHKH